MNSLRARLLAAGGLLVGAFLVAGAAALDGAFRDAALAAQRERLSGLVYALLGAAEEAPGGGLVIMDADLPDARLRDPGSGLAAALIRPADGAVLWHSPGYEPSLPMPAMPAVGQWRFATIGEPERLVLAFGLRWIALDATAREYVVCVWEDPAVIDALVSHFRHTLWLQFALVGAGLLALLLALSHWLLRPLRGMSRQLAEIESGRRLHIDMEVPDELRSLVAALNALVTAERARLARHRQALADLAHKLKTPLAVVRAVVDRHRSAPGMTEIGEAVERMRGIVDHQLARAGSAGTPVLSAPEAVAPVARRVAAAIARLPAGQRLRIEVEADDALRVRVDREDLFDLLGNLLDNAARFAEARVLVRAARAGRQLLLQVEDDGPGFPEDAESLLERGRRADTRHPGQGIGLAQAAEIVAAAGGSLRLGRSSQLGGAMVEIRLPAG